MAEPWTWLAWAFPVFFAVLWLAIFWVIARWGGWRSLAAAYPSLGPLMGDRYRMRSAQLRAGCNYNNCITFISSEAGLHLSLPFFFAFQHPPVFLPWTELRAREGRAWLVPIVVLTAMRCPEIPIRLRKRLAGRVLSRAGSQLRWVGAV